MIDLILQIIMILLSAAFNVCIWVMVIKGKAELKYSLVWVLAGIFLMVCAVFPQITKWIADLMHIETPINAVIVITLVFLGVFSLGLTVYASKQTERLYHITQNMAMLEKRMRELENQIAAQEKPAEKEAVHK